MSQPRTRLTRWCQPRPRRWLALAAFVFAMRPAAAAFARVEVLPRRMLGRWLPLLLAWGVDNDAGGRGSAGAPHCRRARTLD